MKKPLKIGLGILIAFIGIAAIGLLVARGQRDMETGGDKVVRLPAGIDHSAYDILLNKYVDEKGLVAYEEWRASSEDMRALKAYLAQFSPVPEEAAGGDDLSASLINGYNAFAMEMVLDAYPIDSIMALGHPFKGRRFTAGGERVSLDDIEHGTLVPHFGYRAHAVLVCVAKSCPPLRRDAYLPATLDRQADDSFRTWLGRDDLNRFHPEEDRVEVSSVFEWFGDDFEKPGGLRKVLARHAPVELAEFLSGDGYKIEFIPYDWALNDRKSREFSKVRVGWNRVLDYFR